MRDLAAAQVYWVGVEGEQHTVWDREHSARIRSV
jgi:hypothetical protein